MKPELTDDEYEDLIVLFAKNQVSTEENQDLVSQANYSRTLKTLISLKRGIETQLSAEKASLTAKRLELHGIEWYTYLSEREKWRASAIRLKNKIEDKIDSIKHSDNLREGIALHKRDTLAAEWDDSIDQDDVDRRLWSLID